MWIIKKCDINRLRTEKGELRTPVRSDWESTGEVFENKEDADIRRIELYKRGDGYYHVEKQSF